MTTRTCARYYADATPCTNRTDRHDGWCGECPGYPTAQPTAAREQWPSAKRSTWQDAPAAPLDPEEAYEIIVPRTPLDAFVRVHGGTDAQAEAQIRSLLEDMLRDGRVQTDRDGAWRLTSKLGYEVLLSSDAAAVVHYRTFHRERTYAQTKAGVGSRVSTKKARQRAKRAAMEAS